MQNSINHLLAKYTVTDVTPKIWKSLGRKILTHWQRENTVPESSPLLKVMFYENLICEVEELFNVSMTQWHAQVFFLLEPRGTWSGMCKWGRIWKFDPIQWLIKEGG